MSYLQTGETHTKLLPFSCRSYVVSTLAVITIICIRKCYSYRWESWVVWNDKDSLQSERSPMSSHDPEGEEVSYDIVFDRSCMQDPGSPVRI